MYGGCGTGSNRMRWVFGVFCLLAAAALWALSVIERQKCSLCDRAADGTTSNCRDLPSGRFDELGDDVGALLLFPLPQFLPEAKLYVVCMWCMCCPVRGPGLCFVREAAHIL